MQLWRRSTNSTHLAVLVVFDNTCFGRRTSRRRSTRTSRDSCRNFRRRASSPPGGARRPVWLSAARNTCSDTPRRETDDLHRCNTVVSNAHTVNGVQSAASYFCGLLGWVFVAPPPSFHHLHHSVIPIILKPPSFRHLHHSDTSITARFPIGLAPQLLSVNVIHSNLSIHSPYVFRLSETSIVRQIVYFARSNSSHVFSVQ